MVLSIVTDELRVAQERAFALIEEWGLSHVELRGITGGRIPDGDVDEALRLVQRHGMGVTSISPGVFKCRPCQAEIDQHLERLRRTIALCPRFDCRQIIVFSIQNVAGDDAPPPLVVEAIRQAGRLAAAADVRLAIENEPGFHAVTSRSLAALIDEVNMPNVGANWDPGNAWPYDQDIDRGPLMLESRLLNVHAKDTAIRAGERVFDALGKGGVNWRRQIGNLRAMGYGGPVVVETHCEPGVETSRANAEILRAWLG